MEGKLYIVSTPIGNMEDITLRAIRTLGEVDVICCEDTRKTGLLLARLEEVRPPDRSDPATGRTSKGKPQLFSYYEENELQRIPQIIQFLKEGKNVALVSNAGTPTISDPGFKLVREAISQGIKVESIPGASAILTALVSSGLSTDKFLFLGFLPLKPIKRQNIWEIVKKNQGITTIIYESPYKLLKTLEEIKEVFGNIEIVICRELTKMHEEIRREKISETMAYFEKTTPKGELTVLLNLHK